MRFTAEPTYLLPPAPRYAVVSDADVTVARCEYRQWAEHIAALLTADGRDMEPTPNEVDEQLAADAGERMGRNAEESPIPPSPEAEEFRAAAKRFMEGGQP